jgi:hypothetical protein
VQFDKGLESCFGNPCGMHEVRRGARPSASVRPFQKFVWVVYVAIVFELVAMLTGAFAWYPWVPATLALMSAVVALAPAARREGWVACALWIVFALIGVGRQKYFGPLGFAALGTLFIATTAAQAPRLASWMLFPVAFLEAAWLASLGRQMLYELLTVHGLTTAVDACATYLLPIVFFAFLLFAFASSAAVDYYASIDSDTRLRQTRRHGAASARRTGLWIALGAGVFLGLIMWRDWQINMPCM